MNINAYQTRALTTAIYPARGQRDLTALAYTFIGLAGEIGETLNKFKKILRGDKPLDAAMRIALAQELGGVFWYLAASADELGFSLDDIAAMNLAELAARSDRGTLRGDGDDR